MKRCVSITLDIDPEDYVGAEDSPSGAIDLVIACLKGEADLPDHLSVHCQGVTRVVESLDAVE